MPSLRSIVSTNWTQLIIGVICCALILNADTILHAYKLHKNEKDFYDQGFSTHVLIRSSLAENQMVWQLSNGLQIYQSPSSAFTLMVNDSIEKAQKTYTYRVYRIPNDSSQYRYLGAYDFRTRD